jgi:hypothetical protein
MTRYDVRVFFNGRPTAMLDGYRDDDSLHESRLGSLEIDARGAEDAAGNAYALLNRDDRPNARSERSLSVGDVVAVSRGSSTRYFACAMIGWRELYGERALT